MKTLMHRLRRTCERMRGSRLHLFVATALLACSDPTTTPTSERSADLSYVAKLTNNTWQVRTANIDGGSDSALNGTDTPTHFLFYTWSPDGARVAVSGASSDIRLVDLAGQVTRIPVGAYVCEGFEWSPDGTRLAFLTTSSASLTHQAWVVNKDGGAKTALGPPRWYGNSCGFAITWTPDGQYVVYSGENGTEVGTWRIRPDGSGETRISPQRLFDIAISPDGQRIAGASFPLPSSAVVVLSMTTGLELLRFQTATARSFRFPRWSPNGRQLAGGIADAQWLWDVFLLNDDGSGFTRIDANNDNANNYKVWAEWSPDGQRLAFLMRGAINLVDASGLQITRVTADGIAEHSVRWIPVRP